MKTIRLLSIVSLVVLAFVVFAAAAPTRGIPVQSAVSEKSSPISAVSMTNEVVQVSEAAEEIVTLSGESTYALSVCKQTFTPIANTGIDRQRPVYRPPIN